MKINYGYNSFLDLYSIIDFDDLAIVRNFELKKKLTDTAIDNVHNECNDQYKESTYSLIKI